MATKIFTGLLVVMLLSLCGASIFGAMTLKEYSTTQNEIAMLQQMQKATQSFDNHALDTVQEVAQGGYNGIVQVAISGDASQTAIAWASVFNNLGIFLIIVAVIILMMYLDGRKKNKDSGNNYNSGENQ